jgi:hypothetical protein
MERWTRLVIRNRKKLLVEPAAELIHRMEGRP